MSLDFIAISLLLLKKYHFSTLFMLDYIHFILSQSRHSPMKLSHRMFEGFSIFWWRQFDGFDRKRFLCCSYLAFIMWHKHHIGDFSNHLISVIQKTKKVTLLHILVNFQNYICKLNIAFRNQLNGEAKIMIVRSVAIPHFSIVGDNIATQGGDTIRDAII